MFTKNGLCLFKVGTGRRCNQVFAGHYFLYFSTWILFKTQVAIGKDASAMTGINNRNTANFILFHQSKRITNGFIFKSVSGSSISPLSLLFTLRTWAACCSMLMFLCKCPGRLHVHVIASAASVTVSIAADNIGVFKVISLVRRVRISTSLGNTWLYAGTSSTSSNVKPSNKILGDLQPLPRYFLLPCAKLRNENK